MKHWLSAVAFAASLATTPTVSFGQTTDVEGAIIKAFLQFDCTMTPENEDDVVAAIGLDDDVSQPVGMQMMADGRFQQIGDALVLVHPDCPSRAATGVEAAIAWMDGLSNAQAADVLAELLAERGCAYGSEDAGRFDGEVAAAVGRRFQFDETALPLEAMDPFLDALETMNTRGVLQLVRDERVEDAEGGLTLRNCDAG